MERERTLCIIKPDAVGRIQEINRVLYVNRLNIIAQKVLLLSRGQACIFYSENQGKYFFNRLTEFMSSGVIVAQVLEGDGAIGKYRKLLGDTDPAKAKKGTLRSLFGTGMPQNAVHGSADAEAALQEIHFFFSELDILEEYEWRM
ncbi:MAG: nucleoside-diphosphate kinase [Candidatus Sungbacteria bacterium]|nr:nucleoside-diphosphate kinase [Candidatus Sungbacteria bacterium]